MESQHNLAKVIREVESGYEVDVTRRKRRVARIVPPEDDERVEMPDFAARAARIWGTSWDGAGTDELVDDARGER